ncbi:MAG TPA: heme-binding protein, partial [Plasticicumulans sp.]|nr:heme-binding protein [Plasticicumulans sp.]
MPIHPHRRSLPAVLAVLLASLAAPGHAAPPAAPTAVAMAADTRPTNTTVLPLALAEAAARAAIERCEADGHHVSAAVVDFSGLERAYLRGDHATVHTHETAFKKAYTIVTLGPIFGADTTGQLTEKLSKSPTAPALASVGNVILLAGGVLIRAGDEPLAAIGVGGAPGGALDEACAQAGAAAIQARVEAL